LGPANQDEQDIIDFLLPPKASLNTLEKTALVDSPFYNIGVESQKFKDLAAKVSEAIFNAFYQFAAVHLTKGYPSLISGGCGLNCEWNTRWKNCGLFHDVFVPPCTNDTGSAIGTAVDAMRHYTGNAKLDWTVYAGQPFIDDIDEFEMEGVVASHLNLVDVADALYRGDVIGWARSNCEIGPRALGNRSIFAAPFTDEMRGRLNSIKGREEFNPIAPICLEEDVSKHFGWEGPSSHMLYFQKVTDPRLKTIMHLDGSARVQTVSYNENAILHDLISEFKKLSGVGVLCNTSLNYHGIGFINRTSDLYKYAKLVGLDGFVAGITFYRFSKNQ